MSRFKRYQSSGGAGGLIDGGHTAGDRPTTELGLYYYVARWYDPQLGRFIQADTVVPNPGDAKAYDRYSYVINNPINMNDPSGHCYNSSNSFCNTYWQSFTFYAYQVTLGVEFHWQIDADTWKNDDLANIYQAGKDIRTYVDNLTGGGGQKWMHQYLGGTKIDRAENNPYKAFLAKGTSMGLPGWATGNGENTVYLASTNNIELIVHEFAHIWDANTGQASPMGVVNGVADNLNKFIGGDVMSPRQGGNRFVNWQGKWPSPSIPEEFRYPGENIYSNGSTADYLADSFVSNIYGEPKADWRVNLWIQSTISLEITLTR
jgi:RHS repeat-associated protein